MKNITPILAGSIGGLTITLFGTWSSALTTLVIFIGLDYVSGIVVALCGKSKKSENGRLNSDVGYRGLFKKGMSMAVVVIAHRLDLILNSGFLVEAVAIALILNETVSILENLGLLGVPIPEIIKKTISVLNEKSTKNR